MNFQKRTRFAPTPSGYLHIGNVFNLLLTYLTSKFEGAQLGLRIDDIDRRRFRLEYLEDIFDLSDFLGIEFEFGPSGIDDFELNFSQLKYYDKYKNYLNEIKDTFLCDCTRKTLSNNISNIYPGTCRNRNLGKDSGNNLKTRLKILRDHDIYYFKGDIVKQFDIQITIGDFILWNHLEDRPSYQLVSTVHDIEDGISLIVRGKDLLESTFSQEFLRFIFDEEKSIEYNHHDLVMENQQKISKSVLGHGQERLKKRYSRKEIYSHFASKFFNRELTFSTLEDLTTFFYDQKKTLSFESVQIK